MKVGSCQFQEVSHVGNEAGMKMARKSAKTLRLEGKEEKD